MKRFAIIASLVILLFGSLGKVSAQILPDVPDMKGKFTYGGDFDFGIYGRYLNFSIAPQVGYRFFSPWEVGVRGVYNLNCYFNQYGSNQYLHYFGVAPYTNCQVYKGLFVHVEDEILYGVVRANLETLKKAWYNSIFVGGGYRSYFSERGYYYLMLLYNVSWDLPKTPGALDTPYGSPIVFRVGYCF